MAKTFDFTALEQPTLEVTMNDEEHTRLHLCTPTVELLERFTAAAKDARIIAKKKDGQTVQALYELMADIFGNNADGVAVTADDLRKVYNLNLVHFIAFMPVYLEFIEEIKSAKN